jgi:hypothetical protein
MTRLVVPDNTPALYAQTNTSDPLVYALFTHPQTHWFWLVFEYDPETRQCFGLVIGFDSEIGYFDMAELERSGCVNLPHPKPELQSEVRARLEDNEDDE